MAQGKAIITKDVELSLTDREARYLKDVLQNYLGQGKEPPEDQKVREGIFSVLHTLFKGE